MPKKTYIAQNRIAGLAKKDIETGEKVLLEEDDAAPLVAGGSLKQASKDAEDKPAEKTA